MKVITLNRKALHNYEIVDRLEAGIALTGSEIKSIREGHVSFRDAYCEIIAGEAWLVGCHISLYSNASYNNHEPERRRKLLLHQQEIKRWDGKVRAKGVTIVPLQMHFNPRGMVKIEIGLARGRREYEKKRKLKERDVVREMDRELSRFKKR
jgi:SsrA-binding protein